MNRKTLKQNTQIDQELNCINNILNKIITEKKNTLKINIKMDGK